MEIKGLDKYKEPAPDYSMGAAIDATAANVTEYILKLRAENESLKAKQTAHWVIICDGYYPICSACKQEPPGRAMSAYCPNCGAKMETEK